MLISAEAVKKFLLETKTGFLVMSFVLLWFLNRADGKTDNVSNKSSLLSERVKAEMSQHQKITWWDNIKGQLHELYLPSFPTIALLLIFWGLIFFAQRYFNFDGTAIDFKESNHFQNLIAILAGISALIFALVIFVAEQAGQNNDRGRVILKVSYLYPLVVSVIIVFLSFLWFEANLVSLIALFIIAFGLGFSVYNLFRTLIYRTLFEKERNNLLINRIKRGIVAAIQDRIGNTILLNELSEDKIKLTFYPGTHDEEDFYAFGFGQTGVVKDINLDYLKQFADEVEQSANSKGLSFYKNKPKSSSAKNTPEAADKPESFQHDGRVYLTKFFKTTLAEEENGIIYVRKNLIDNKDIKKLQSIFEKIFIIGKEETYSEDIRLEFEDIKDNFITAIADEKTSLTDYYIKTIINFAETFIKLLKKFGGNYDYKQAKQERSNIIGGWNFVQWLTELVSEAFSKGISSKNRRIARRVSYLPLAIAINSIENYDQYLFQEFMGFIPSHYYEARKLSDKGSKKELIELATQRLKEIADYKIEYEIKYHKKGEEQLKSLGEFAEYLLLIALRLLKESHNNLDLLNFTEFARVSNELFDDLDPWNDHPNIQTYEFWIKGETDATKKEELNNKYKVQKLKEDVAKNIKNKKTELFFGFSGWLLKKFLDSGDEQDFRFFEITSKYLPDKIEDLTNAFKNLHGLNRDDFWGWGWWDIVRDGRVHSMDSNSKFEYIFVVQGLKILAATNDKHRENLNIPHSRNIANLAETNSSLMVIINDIINHPKSWEKVLNSRQREQVDLFIKLLNKSKEAYKHEEEEQIKNYSIPQSKVDEFKNKVLEGFKKNTNIRKIIGYFGKYEDLTFSNEVHSEVPLWGLSQIDFKEAFIEHWHVHYAGWGETYGESIAQSEDEKFLDLLANTKEATELSNWPPTEQILEFIESNNIRNPVILETLDYLYEWDNLRKSNNFVNLYSPQDQQNKTNFPRFNSFVGYFDFGKLKIPVYRLRHRHNNPAVQNNLFAVSLEELGVWNQFAPIENQEDKTYQKDVFMIKVIDLNACNETRQGIINKRPAWLNEHTDPENYLKQRVLNQVFEKFEYEIKDKNKYLRIKMIKSETN